jgi:hypothetical protein
MNKKYELRDYGEAGMFRVVALRDFANVKKGERGGLVRGEHNLSHDGNCWLGLGGAIFGNARVEGEDLIDNVSLYAGTIKAASEITRLEDGQTMTPYQFSYANFFVYTLPNDYDLLSPKMQKRYAEFIDSLK